MLVKEPINGHPLEAMRGPGPNGAAANGHPLEAMRGPGPSGAVANGHPSSIRTAMSLNVYCDLP